MGLLDEGLGRAVLNSIDSHVALLDPDGKILAVNDAWMEFAGENIVGSRSRIGVGTNYLESCRMAATDDPDAQAAFTGILSVLDGSRSTFELEYSSHSPSEQRWFSMTVTPIKRDKGGAVVVHTDITDLVSARGQLQESQQRYRSFIRNSTEAIWCIQFDEPIPLDLPEQEQVDRIYRDGRVIEANELFAEVYGATLSEVIGWQVETFLPRSLPTSVPFLLEAIRSGYRMKDAETVERDANGEEKIFLNSFAGTVVDGKVSLVWGTSRDVTELRHTERQLRLRNEELELLKNRLTVESRYLQEEIKSEHNFDEIIGNSPAMMATLYKLDQVAGTDATVLLLGETGTGKELFARAIHSRSERKTRALIKVDCTTLPAGLIESELFGHEKGAFTGAHDSRPGRFELADGGTIFLDEIGELPLELQGKLLRVIQEGEFERLGAKRAQKVDVRIITATNRDLHLEMREGRFRSDLYYRLGVFPIEIPPLRDRREDIPLLASYFISQRGKAMGRRVDSVPQSTQDALMAYDWPGNIRELQNILEHALILSPGRELILPEELKPAQLSPDAHDVGGVLRQDLEGVEREKISDALERSGWKIKGEGNAASRLGLKPSTLRSRMKKLGIQRPT